MGKTSNIALLAQGFDSRESGEPRALGYLQRLNLAGYDVKGQLSSAYGQSGVSLSVAAKVDFGSLLVPFVHLDLGADVKGERTAHSVLVLQRMPARVWIEDMVQPPQPPRSNPAKNSRSFPKPYWMANRPLALAFLHGTTWRLKASAVADAWAGLGSLGDYDETGATFGAAVKGQAGGTLTRLADIAPRHYPPTPSDSSLNDDVDDLFEDGLKTKAAAWLVEMGGGVLDLGALGVPRTPLVELAEEHEWLQKARAFAGKASGSVEPGLLKLMEFYDKLTIPDVDSVAIGGVGFSLVKELVRAAKKIKSIVASKKLVTADLLAELASVRGELKDWANLLSKPQDLGLITGQTRRTLWEIARLRMAEADDFIAALKRREARKALRQSTPAARAAIVDKSPLFHLDITAVEAGGDVQAGGKVVLMRDRANVHLAAGAEFLSRRISFRYQSFVPEAGRRTLLCSQDTAINYTSRKISVQGSLGKRKLLKERPNLVTMSYRSVLVNWFDDLDPDNHKAIPNGSGVSFGMSVLAESFGVYARVCKEIAKPLPGKPPAEMDDDLKELETALTKQLRVKPQELRAFMRNAPSSMGNVPMEDPDEEARVESYLIESAFALTAPIALDIDDHRPKSLFALDPVKTLVANGTRGTALRLQVIRMRFRIRSDDDKSRNLIQLGWNPEPWGEGLEPWGAGSVDADESLFVRLTGIDVELPNWLKLSSLAVELGLGIERVRRVGSEGIAELYYHLYPDPYSHRDPPEGFGRERAKTLEAFNHMAITDMMVPPVALFSQ